MLLLSGCTIDEIPDLYVFFDNRTSQTLYLRDHDDERDSKEWFKIIEPNTVSKFLLLHEGSCVDWLVIEDENGGIVKDPGTVCWHDTIVIP